MLACPALRTPQNILKLCWLTGCHHKEVFKELYNFTSIYWNEKETSSVLDYPNALKWYYFWLVRLEVPAVKMVFSLPDFGDWICSLYPNGYLSALLQGRLFTVPSLPYVWSKSLQSVYTSVICCSFNCFPFSFPFSSLLTLLGQ